MADDLTPWEDINPTMGAAQPPAPPPRSSDLLTPASDETFAAELTACLALVVPVGMDEAARREWLSVAWITLKHLPADILASGCRKARETCDHPSKIVPTILKATEDWMRLRRDAPPSSGMLYLPAPRKRDLMEHRGEAMSEEDTAELNRILEWSGATARYRPDGSRYTIDQAA